MQYLGLLDYVVIVAIMLFLVGIGLYFTKRGGADMDSFFLGGRSLPWYIAGTSMIATSFAADTPLWVTNLVRTFGIHYIWQFWAPLIGSALAVVYFGRKVITRPTEATAIGNLVMQMLALGDIASLAEGREIIRDSFADESETYEPQDAEEWRDALIKWRSVCAK